MSVAKSTCAHQIYSSYHAICLSNSAIARCAVWSEHCEDLDLELDMTDFATIRLDQDYLNGR